jgi:hypothetical protein
MKELLTVHKQANHKTKSPPYLLLDIYIYIYIKFFNKLIE